MLVVNVSDAEVLNLAKEKVLASVAGYLACCGDVNEFAKIAKCHTILSKPCTVFVSEDVINREGVGCVSAFLEGW